MVTPISFVADILNSEDFVRERAEIERKQAQDVTGGVASDAGFRAKPTEDSRTRGTEPEGLAIDLPMDEAGKKMFEAGKPPRRE
jgi:hypothetical protein